MGETRQKIVAIAIALIRQHGFNAVTMEQIAEAADIAKGTLYNYFPVKEAILSAYIQGALQDKFPDRAARLVELPDTRSRMRLVFTELIAGMQTQQEIFDKYLIYQVQNILTLHKTGEQRGGIDHLAAQIIQLGQASGELRGDLPQSVLEDLFAFTFIEIVKLLTRYPQKADAQAAIDSCLDLFMRGVQAEPLDTKH